MPSSAQLKLTASYPLAMAGVGSFAEMQFSINWYGEMIGWMTFKIRLA